MEHIKALLPTDLQQMRNSKIQQLSSNELNENSQKKTPEDYRCSLNVSSLEHTFGNFVMTSGLDVVFKTFRKFAEKLYPTLILCYGGIGNGKTYMLEAAAIRLREREIFVRVGTWNRFTGVLKNSMRDRDSRPSYEQILTNYCKASILLMDDYGMGTTDTAWEKSILEELVNYRYYNRLPTVLTTNKMIEDLPDRVVSRFSEEGIGVIIENKGGDYRRRVRTNG